MNIANQDTRFLELLHKWRTGGFTRADEQEMRVLASDDQFRQEAMEGMLEHPELDHVSAVTGLRAWIRGKQPGRRVRFPQILAVAATLVLIFGAIWFFNIRPIPAEQGQMAIELPTSEEAQKESAAPIVSVSPSPKEMRSKSVPQPSGSAGPIMGDVDKLAKSESAPPIVEAKDDSRYNEGGRDIAADEFYRTTPQPPGSIIDQTTNVAPPPERAKEEARYAKKKKASKPSAVLGQQQNPQQNAGKSTADDAVPQANQPKDGWISFRTNLSNKARLTPAALANNITGTVRLQFALDKKSQPVDFKLINGLGYGCDEAAIQLIKEASWIRVDNQVITVDVPFVR